MFLLLLSKDSLKYPSQGFYILKHKPNKYQNEWEIYILTIYNTNLGTYMDA